MPILEDTRQQKGKHEIKHQYWQRRGATIVRGSLPFGDYAIISSVVVDTKRDIYEIAGNIEHDHTRFRNECIRAMESGCRLVILVENLDGVDSLDSLAQWSESEAHYRMRKGGRRYSGKRLARAMSTMSERYGVEWDFCTPNEAGRRVIEILEGGGRCPKH